MPNQYELIWYVISDTQSCLIEIEKSLSILTHQVHHSIEKLLGINNFLTQSVSFLTYYLDSHNSDKTTHPFFVCK